MRRTKADGRGMMEDVVARLKDLTDESIYHLVVRPRNPIQDKWYGGVMPEIKEDNLAWESESDCVMRVEI